MKSQFVLPKGGPLEELLFRVKVLTEMLQWLQTPGGMENVMVSQVDWNNWGMNKISVLNFLAWYIKLKWLRMKSVIW